ncbi:ABC transporter permease [Gaetbulibacter saemankumensis]|uniref:ABC transporter permease n=1 Tax=Gaetbulibacter saemankumensis TaxID=311208 RepID=UPI0003FF6CE1|nr:ABC transporter permease [Gaetbulibacter saemankumensis]
MFDLDLWREIFQSINKNRVRSLLSGFTVSFAILLFVILFGIANGLKNTFKEAFGNDALNRVFVNSGRTVSASEGLQAGRRIQFKNEDYNFIKDEFQDKVEFITGQINKNVNASFRNEKNNYNVRAIHPDHQFIENTEIKEGRFINQNDLNNTTKVVVIGRLVEEDLFLQTKALGKYINLSGIPYKIVGVFADDGGDSEERLIYMPITTAQRVYGNNDDIDQITLTYNPELNYDQALAFSNLLTSKLKDRFSVSATDQRAIRVHNLATEAKRVNIFNLALTSIILIIGLGTLIAGVVGISNIMIFIVKERTKEIGIRKALGASPRSIVSIILIECIIVTTIAGYVGLLIGFGVLKLSGPGLAAYMIKDPYVSTSLVISATITLILAGAIAGYFPAKRASNIKPIVAIRNE